MAGSNQLQMLADRYGQNETIGNQIVGAMVDNALGFSQTGQALAYNEAMNDSTARMISGLRQDDFGYNTQLLAQQAEISSRLNSQNIAGQEGLARVQGSEDRLSRETQGAQDRLGYLAQGEQQRLGIAAQGAENRLGYITQGEQQRLGISAQGVEDRSLAQTQGRERRLDIGATGEQDRLSIAARGAEDRSSIRESGSESRKGIETQGQQERLSEQERTTQLLRTRADARGQIARTGARFFG